MRGRRRVPTMAIDYPKDAAQRALDLLRHRTEQLRAKWQGVSASFDDFLQRRSSVAPIPTAAKFEQLLDTAFMASLTREEGRDVTFRLHYCDSRVALDSHWPLLLFDTPIPYTVEALRKLSPACAADAVDIGVFEFDSGLCLWGLTYIRRNQPGQRARPGGLTIATHQPGVLHVRIGFDMLLTYSRGSTFVQDPDGGIDVTRFRSLLAQVFDALPDFPRRFAMAARILDMANEALACGHGATILVVPANMERPNSLGPPRYPISDRGQAPIQAAFLDVAGINATRGVAHLAFRDGALLMDETGLIRLAGSMIEFGRDDQAFDVVALAPSAPRTAERRVSCPEFGGGARHRSALVFCHKNPGALAFVVSHDGIMTILTRPVQEALVLAISPILLGTDIGV